MQFVKTEDYKKLENFAKRDLFYNIFISGPKGCGKTKTIEKIHEDLGKPLIRVNVSIETDEDSLIGGFRLRDGNTILDKGPVLLAMEQGATLLLDEVDQGHPQRLMCLQSILEGSGYHIKRTNEMVYPKKGFKVWATANTKGSGDETGQYIGAQILNSAMKDRFAAFFDFTYPTKEVELEIISEVRNSLEKVEFSDTVKKISDKQLNKLVAWAQKVRSIDSDIDLDETISSRKLIDIVKGFYFVQDLKVAMENCIRGYPAEHVDSFMKIYDLLDDEGNTIQTYDPATTKKPMLKF